MSTKQKSRPGPAPERDKDWPKFEFEVAHYYQNEEGVSAQSYEIKAQSSEGPAPPRFPPGADYWMMWTAIDRLREADRIMPFRGVEYRSSPAPIGESGANKQQSYHRDSRPSCSMVLRARYGVKACRYDDQAPRGDHWLTEAQKAYCQAARRVPARKRPDLMAKVLARFERAFA